MRMIFALALVTATVACANVPAAHAGLLGTPLNLRAAFEANHDTASHDTTSIDSAAACPRYAGDFLAAPALLIEC